MKERHMYLYITILLNLNFNSYQNKQGMRRLQFRNITKQDIENIHCIKFAPSVMMGWDGIKTDCTENTRKKKMIRERLSQLN